MKNLAWKRMVAGILSTLCLFSITACQKETAQTPEQQSADGKVFTQPTKLNLVISVHPSWPYDENWKAWEYFKEATGADLAIQAIPGADYETKVSLMMSSPETLPDMMHMTDKRLVDAYTMDGAFVCLDDYAEQMPNYTKFFDSIPMEEKEELLNQHRAFDGKIYQAPAWGAESAAGLTSWIYRKDIFEKHNLEIPKTMEEVYTVSKKLKELYPNSYPLCFRDGLPKIDLIGPSWMQNFSTKLYYDYENKSWHYGAAEDIMREIVEYFRKMHQEGLLPPDFTTITTKSWEELMSTDRGFITMEYTGRIDFFNLPNRKTNPEYTWAVMAPPVGNSATGSAKTTKLNMDLTGYVICNTGKQENIQNSIRLLDWMYSDDAFELLSWGKEGETYQVKDGKKEYILEADEVVNIKYGIGTLGTYQRIDRDAISAANSPELRAQIEEATSYLETNSNPTNWLALLPDEQKQAEELRDAIVTYTDEQLSKFLQGMIPMSEWDVFQKNLRDMDLETYIKIYDTAYRRAMGN